MVIYDILIRSNHDFSFIIIKNQAYSESADQQVNRSVATPSLRRALRTSRNFLFLDFGKISVVTY